LAKAKSIAKRTKATSVEVGHRLRRLTRKLETVSCASGCLVEALLHRCNDPRLAICAQRNIVDSLDHIGNELAEVIEVADGEDYISLADALREAPSNIPSEMTDWVLRKKNRSRMR